MCFAPTWHPETQPHSKRLGRVLTGLPSKFPDEPVDTMSHVDSLSIHDRCHVPCGLTLHTWSMPCPMWTHSPHMIDAMSHVDSLSTHGRCHVPCGLTLHTWLMHRSSRLEMMKMKMKMTRSRTMRQGNQHTGTHWIGIPSMSNH